MIWRDIKGYEGRYQISDEGHVRSLARTVPGPQGRECQVRERILKQCEHVRGYSIIFLSKENKDTKFFVHRLVAMTFIPNPEQKPIVNHKSLDKKENHVANLEWATEAENTQHYWRGRDPHEPF